MKLQEIAKILDAEILACCDSDVEIMSACGSDLMSDVMAFVKENVLLLTGLVSPQDIDRRNDGYQAVVSSGGKVPGKDIIDMASEKGIAVLATCEPMFVACGKLYSAGLTGRVSDSWKKAGWICITKFPRTILHMREKHPAGSRRNLSSWASIL